MSAFTDARSYRLHVYHLPITKHQVDWFVVISSIVAISYLIYLGMLYLDPIIALFGVLEVFFLIPILEIKDCGIDHRGQKLISFRHTAIKYLRQHHGQHKHSGQDRF